jgi:hypothetical protein
MLIESFIPNSDAVETRKIEIAASRQAVYQALSQEIRSFLTTDDGRLRTNIHAIKANRLPRICPRSPVLSGQLSVLS